MKKKIIMLLAAVLTLLATVNARGIKTLTVYFDKDQTTLNATEKVKLMELKQADMVMLKGHTDEDGSEAYNVALSKKRVEEVKAAIRLLDSGIKIETGFYGEAKPVNQNRDEKEKTQNRRVEVAYISDPVLRIKTPVQFYEIDATKANTISCREGTQIEVPANAFAEKKVLIKVSEYYNAASIFSANLSTRCNNAPIESAGMIYVTAEINGESIEPTKPLKFKFPRGNTNKDFKIFEGERKANFEMNWKLDKKPVTQEAAVLTAAAPDTTYFFTDMISTEFYTANVTGVIQNQLTDFWNKMSDRNFRREHLVDGCIEKAIVDITVNTDGRITSVTTNFTNKSTECDRVVQKYIRAALPVRFKPLTWASKINIHFQEVGSVTEIVDMKIIPFAFNDLPVQAANLPPAKAQGWVPGFGDEFSADYETDKIVLTSSKLGWINCDRFLQTTWVDYTVQTDTSANVRVLMKKYKSFFINEYLNGDYTTTMRAKGEGKFIFRKIPANEEVLIVSTKKVNGKIMLAMENAKTSSGGVFQNLKYREVTAKELEAALKDLKI